MLFRSGCDLGEAGLDASKVVAELLAKDLYVRLGPVLDPAERLVRGEGDGTDVELLLDVGKEGADVVEVLGVGVEDDKLVERSLRCEQGSARSDAHRNHDDAP